MRKFNFWIVLKNKIKSLMNFIGLFLPISQIVQLNKSSNDKSVLIINHGEISIPPKGWGAVEYLAHETSLELSNFGFKVTLLNSKSIWKWLNLSFKNIDIIILHDDTKALRSRLFWPKATILLFTHYGYAGFSDKWSKDYKNNVHNRFKFVDYIICISPSIFSTMAKIFDKGMLVLSPNGSNSEYRELNSSNNGKMICLGKVEKRKRQIELFDALVNSSVEVDFFGPVVDKSVLIRKLINREDNLRFKGEIDRKALYSLLPEYKCLIHVSEAEADALVLYEAQLAGLPIIVTENAIGSQDRNLPWICVIPNDFTKSDIINAINSIKTSNLVISEYAKTNYRWENRLKPIIELIKSFE